MSEVMGVEGVLNHLMFHKAMIDEDDRAEKIDRYLSILEQARSNISPKDPLDRSLETVFELVLSNNFDPWDIDLKQFTTLYAQKVKGEEVNFVIAGKLMLMAWSILRMQSEIVLQNNERHDALFCSDWDMENMDMFYPEREVSHLDVCLPDEVELCEVVRHHGTRPVSLVELLDAFDEARREEEVNLLRQKIREQRKLVMEKFDTKAHGDDLEHDVEMVWQRILKCGIGAISIEDICEGGREDLVTVFMALLFLVRSGKIAVWQDDMPYGKIFLEVKVPWDIGTLEDVPSVSIPKPRVADREAVM